MMNNKGKIDPNDLKIQGLIDGYLRVNSVNKDFERSTHLDEDTLTAFVEGNLTEPEAKPITSHLVSCSFCRNITAELIKLDIAFAFDTQSVTVAKSEPTKVSEVLNGILSRIFGTSDGAVFAHQETEEDEKNDEKDSKNE